MVPQLTGGKKKLIKNKVMPYSNEPFKKYGTPEPVMAKGYLKISGKVQPPALLAKCGMGRYGKKK